MRTALFSLLAILAAPGTAIACSYAPGVEPPTTEQLFQRASFVFFGHLTKVEEVEGNIPGHPELKTVLEATFATKEVFKGTPPEDNKVRSLVWMPGNCSQPLLAGMDYIFFTPENGFVGWTSGTFPVQNPNAPTVQEGFAKLRALGQPGGTIIPKQ